MAAAARRKNARCASKADALLERAGPLAVSDDAGDDLPMGLQKLLEVVRALMAGRGLLLLDEPAAGLNDTETLSLAAAARRARRAA